MTFALALAIAPAPAIAQDASAPSSTPTPAAAALGEGPLEIDVVGLRTDSGEVGCSLFNGPEGYPRDGTKVMRHVWAPVKGRKATCIFTGLAPGQYAAVVFHDENGDRQFNVNAFGMPKEGYGFSNNAAALFGPPEFSAASFGYTGKSNYMIINIRY